MADLWLPTWLKCAKVGFRYLDSTGISRGMFGGPPKTAAKGGDRLGMHLEFTPTATSSVEAARERRTLIALLRRLRSKQNRLHAANPARVLAGSFPTGELLTNNTFANGTTGWTADNSILTVVDRVGRVTATTPAANVQLRQSVSLTQYVPYVLRSMIVDGAGTAGLTIGPAINDAGGVQVTDYQTARGLRTAVLVASATGAANQFQAVFSSVTGFTAGAYIEVPWCSLSRCALVDNGPNLLLQSQDFFTTWTKSGLTLPTANNTDVAVDGTTTAETIGEDTGATEHYLTQSVTVAPAAADYSFSCHFKASSRSWAYLRLVEATGSTAVSAFINLSTGALGTTATGANWSNLRTHIRAFGNGWYRLILTARKTNAATTLNCHLGISSGDNVFSYTGASLAIAGFGASLAPSSVPVRYNATTTTALPTGTSQALGGGLHIKGLLASTNDLLVQDDEYQIGNGLHACDTSLNSDAAGLGFLIGNPPMRTAPADNAPVIIHEPMGYFMFNGDAVGWEHEPGIITNASADFEEA